VEKKGNAHFLTAKGAEVIGDDEPGDNDAPKTNARAAECCA
jgi:hypothetical protein